MHAPITLSGKKYVLNKMHALINNLANIVVMGHSQVRVQISLLVYVCNYYKLIF